MRKRQAEIEQPRVRPTPKARARVSVPRPTGKRPTASDTFACGTKVSRDKPAEAALRLYRGRPEIVPLRTTFFVLTKQCWY
ncbi:hypothetical protein DIPPA_31494 [Diplonema papillatum]|nr:hypothetical protein DIPPA_31494 [Diplonema papillatum]